MVIMSEKAAGRNKTMEICLELLEAVISSDRGPGVRELSKMLNFPKSTVHRHLRTLQHYKLLEVNGEGKYVVGAELYRLAARALTKVEIRKIAVPYMNELVGLINETVYLCLYEKARIVFIDKVECTHDLRHFAEIGKILSLHPHGATGKAILAFLPENERQEVIAGIQKTDHCLSDVGEYERELEQVKSEGFAFSLGVRVPGVYGIASPLFKGEGVIGALDVTIPQSRIEQSKLVSIGHLVKKYAQEISYKMGYA